MGPLDPGRLPMVGGDRHLVLPPLRLVAVVRGGPFPEATECTDATDGGRCGVELVMMGANRPGGMGEVEFGSR